MLTVKQINEVSFGKAGFSGYKPEDVDDFIDEVASSFQQLEAERDEALKRSQELAVQNSELAAKNAEIQEKLSILAKRIESYREDEDGIKEALLSAQRLAKASVKEAQDKAEVIVQDAKDNAAQILESAKTDAARASEQYAAQAEEKKEELEEIKRQVTAFRASLLEMYKKHLEQINHIPNFRQKEKPAEEPQESAASAEEPVVQEEAPKAEEPAPVVVEQPEPQPQPEPEPEPVPVEQPVAQPEPLQRPTLHDRVDFTRPTPQEEDDFADEDLSDVGIDLKTYSSIPESLRREKNSHFSNLEFGDDVDLDERKRKK